MRALRTDGSAEQSLLAIDKLRTSTSRQTMASVRVAFHGHRGERQAFVRALDEMDRLAAQAGSIWRNDVQVPRMLWSTYTLCEDVMSLKRAVQQLDTLADEVPSIARLRDVTQACYLAERGMATEALARHEQTCLALESDTSVRAVPYMGAYARLLRKAGQPARARQVCEATLARLDREQLAFTMLVFGVRIELTLALALTGEIERAVQLLRELAAEQRDHDNPLLHGLTHGTRAELALLQRDMAEAQQQLAAMGNWFRSTDHPALFAQFQRLFDRARASSTGEIVLQREGATPSIAAGPHSGLVLGAGSALPDLTALLHVAVADSQAEFGYVCAIGEGGLALRAKAGKHAVWSVDVSELVASMAEHGDDAFATELFSSPPGTGDGPALSTLVEDVGGVPLPTLWQGKPAVWFLLSGESAGKTAPVGALLLVEGSQPLKRLGALVLGQLARAVCNEAAPEPAFAARA